MAAAGESGSTLFQDETIGFDNIVKTLDEERNARAEAAAMLLNDAEWTQWSNRFVADFNAANFSE